MPPYKRVMVIINPVSGQHDAARTRKLIESRLQASETAYETRFTRGAGDAIQWAEGAAGEGFDALLVCGGDGTVVEAMSGAIKGGADLPVAQIPVGTARHIARGLSIPMAMKEALELLFTGKEVRFDVGYLPQYGRYFGLICGAGWDARMIEDSPRQLKRILGFMAYVLVGIKQFFLSRKTDISLELDHESVTLRAHTAMIVNIGRIDKPKMTIGPDIYHHDGVLNVVVLASEGLLGILSLAWRVARQELSNYPDLHYFRAKRIKIDASPPLPVQIDGDSFGDTPLEVEVVPDGVKVVVPQDYLPERGEEEDVSEVDSAG